MAKNTDKNVFRYNNAINNGFDLPIEDDYNTYLINRSYSNFLDTILLINEVNMFRDIDPQMHFDFLRGVVRTGKRYAKWHKPVKHREASLISKYFQVSMVRAYSLLHLFSEQELNEIEEEIKEKEKNE